MKQFICRITRNNYPLGNTEGKFVIINAESRFEACRVVNNHYHCQGYQCHFIKEVDEVINFNPEDKGE